MEQQVSPPEDWWTGETQWVGPPLTAGHLQQCCALARAHLLANQLPAGNFVYAYDWQQRQVINEDNPVRQAGAYWGLAQLQRAQPEAATASALATAQTFWSDAARDGDAGRCWFVYPGAGEGRTGALALVLLSVIAQLRTRGVAADQRSALEGWLEAGLAQCLHLQTGTGHFFDAIDPSSGDGHGPISPYADGEVLLAMAQSARYCGHPELWPVIEQLAEAGYRDHVCFARQQDADSAVTKGYYQWASMSWFEMIGSGHCDADLWSERLIELACWMIDTHRILRRRRNTAYAFEGIVCAYATARFRDDPRAGKLSNVIRIGLRQLLRWQVGHPLANAFVRGAAVDDAQARGGVQNARNEALLRIDVAQHQAHAALLALSWWWPLQAEGAPAESSIAGAFPAVLQPF
ncbi:MAG: hypothetical protein ACX94A_13680 [Algiphilus sp.]